MILFRRSYPFLMLLAALFLKPEISSAAPKNYEVLSLSAAIIDHLVQIDDASLKIISEEKGSWRPIDYPALCKYLDALEGKIHTSPGGSGVNVLKGLANLGHSCAVIGKVGSDAMGDYYIEQLNKRGITSFLQRGSLPSGQAICFITPEGERTFLCYQGASHSHSDLELDPEIFDNIALFHVEGYQLVDPELVLKALKLAKMKNVKISLDLANMEIVRRHKLFIKEILNEYVDIVMCNQDEARELTGLEPKEACALLAQSCTISVVTMSDKGSWTQGPGEQFFTPAFFVEAVDTTGAGDYFTSGFLHGILSGATLQTCALQGALIASHVVSVIGTELSEESWKEIHLKLQSKCYAKAHLSFQR